MNKIKKILNYIYEDVKNNIIFYIVLLVILLLNVIKIDCYIFSPGSLTSLDGRINVENAYSQSGSFNLTYVTSREGTLFNVILSYIIPSWDKVDLEEINVEGESNEDALMRNQLELKETSYDAIIAAFDAANLTYEIKSLDLAVSYINDIAETDLKVGDIITKVNDESVSDMDNLHVLINKNKVNDKIKLTVKREDSEVECYAVLKDLEGSTVIGVIIVPLKEIQTTPKVEYVFNNRESGSSRGLLCALEIYNRITEYDITKGRKISGTGVIDEDGNVGAIDGVKYKIAGAVKKDADIFIVPSENYDEAVKIKNENNYDIQIIKADTLENVIEELKK